MCLRAEDGKVILNMQYMKFRSLQEKEYLAKGILPEEDIAALKSLRADLIAEGVLRAGAVVVASKESVEAIYKEAAAFEGYLFLKRNMQVAPMDSGEFRIEYLCTPQSERLFTAVAMPQQAK